MQNFRGKKNLTHGDSKQLNGCLAAGWEQRLTWKDHGAPSG